jgi:tRNA pseudouridine13 synthase
MSTSITREREDDDEGLRSPKRTKVDDLADEHTPDETLITAHENEPESILPPSHVLLGVSSPPISSDGLRQVLESDVGISEYISREVAPISGIIKQR